MSGTIRVLVVDDSALMRKLLPQMLQRGSGRILNVASTAAFVPGPFMAVYYATKAFVASFSHAIANEVGGGGVSVTVLCPGATRTGFERSAGAERSNLFHGNVMTAAEVARQGYRAMLEGRAEVSDGVLVWSGIAASRW